MSNASYVFAGGGTGGHLFPGLAVAEALREQTSEARIAFFTTTRALDRQLLEPTAYEQITQPVQPLTLNPLKLPGFWLAWRRSVQAARGFLKARQVRAVLGLGGYAAGPAVVAARKLGIRTAILNPDAIPGRANRHLAGYAELVVLQWDVTRQYFPRGTNCQALGCPIRAGFTGADPAAGRRRFELVPERPVLLVTGASQGARTINQTVTRVWPAFHTTHPEWQLLHLSGPADEAAVRAAYATAKVPARVLSFTHEMPLALAAADLVISRAGASTLAELTALGKPAILFPYPYHRDRHQHANGQILVNAGAAIMLEDRRSGEKNEAALRTALDQAADPRRRGKMATAAAGLARNGAADDVAAFVVLAWPESEARYL
ncbi:MAG: UDP-N-acetylglucosamine--N-acetylmuramyl-(pentapeptide) pyrophosphoryl-undecaprenol N-acetylglucosamine transferase [Phycisphaerae bacterium]|nr:UDP-N-acetylglucosamine--N-acetylmuramyl-(pentapeptide) pyrophosphoryl-undecaprenol N-acetylglucosamine transferase [Phycisphaerae bacterium]